MYVIIYSCIIKKIYEIDNLNSKHHAHKNEHRNLGDIDTQKSTANHLMLTVQFFPHSMEPLQAQRDQPSPCTPASHLLAKFKELRRY